MVTARKMKYTQSSDRKQLKHDGTPIVPEKRSQDHLLGESSAHALAVNLIVDRAVKGIETYRTPLRPFNGREQLQDAVEEIADLLCYLLNEQSERRIEASLIEENYYPDW